MIFQRVSQLVSHLRPQLKVVQGFKSAARKLSHHPRKFLLSAAAMSSYDWEEEKYSDKELVKYFQDIDFCSKLKLETLTCEACGLRLKIDVVLPEISYCKCPGTKSGSADPLNGAESGWLPYVERKDILVWRKEHAKKKGLYHYKLYGLFDDITVWEFLAVQLDLSQFRIGWDSSTAQCKEVDIQKQEVKSSNITETPTEDETPVQGVSKSSTLVLGNGCVTNEQDASEAMIYYWEVHWPTFFSNRDYCCLRQHLTDPTGRMVISSRTTTHAKCPAFKKNWRVQDYQSVMAVRPTVHPDKPGVEFSLTAFEDPGVALPESIISWVAVRAMPEFMTNLRAACLKLRGAVGSVSLPKPELFRREALLREEWLFEHRDSDGAIEEIVSKGDAAYESAWIDKLLKDSDESESESEENPVVARKSSLEFEAESIRKEPVVVFHEPDSVGKPLNLFNSDDNVGHKTSDKTSFDTIASPSLDDIDELDAKNNMLQQETLDLYKTEKLFAHKGTNALKDKMVASSNIDFDTVKDSPPMDDNTLNPTAVNEEILKPNPDVTVNNPSIKQSPVSSPMRHNLLLLDETQDYNSNDIPKNVDVEQMSISSSSEQITPNSSEQSSPEKVTPTSFLLGAEQILSSSGYIEHEMELLLYEEKEISTQSALLDQKLRVVEVEGGECENLLQLWFQLVTRKNIAFHRRLMLEILESEQDLEKRCELLQVELRRGGRGELGEKLLLEELLKVVDMRDQLVMDRDREERNLQEEMILGEEVETKMASGQDIKKEKCKMQ